MSSAQFSKASGGKFAVLTPVQDCGNNAPLTDGPSSRGRLYASTDWVVFEHDFGDGPVMVKKLREDWCP